MNGNGVLTWIESMSTENTRAPSFASNAARGRPTTSDLRRVRVVDVHHFYATQTSPIDNGDDPPIGSIAVRQDPVIHPHVFEAFHDREGRAWKDRFDRSLWGLIVDRHGDLPCRRDSGLR